MGLTLVFWLLDQLPNHGLDDSYVSICHDVRLQIDVVLLTYSLSSPPKALPANATQTFVEKTTMSSDKRVPAHPMSRTGFRPIRSDTPPQAMPVRDSARAKEEMKMPAQKEALDLSPMLESLTITQA